MQSAITDESSRTAASQISEIKEALSEQVGPQKYKIWFKNSTNMTLADGYLKVGVPNLFIASWIEKHFLKEISQAVQTVTGADVKVTFSIDPELSGHQRRSKLDSKASAVPNVLSGKKAGPGRAGYHGRRKKKLKLIYRPVSMKGLCYVLLDMGYQLDSLVYLMGTCMCRYIVNLIHIFNARVQTSGTQ